MQVSVENLGGLGRRMKVQVPADTVDREIDQRLRSVGKRARLKGYRPGKIPFKVIKQRYGEQVRQEVLGDLLNRSFSEAVQQEKLVPAGGPKIEPAPLKQGEAFEYTAEFEVYPEVSLNKIAGIEVVRRVADIEDEDVDRVVENLRQQRATWEPVDRPAIKGDQVMVDFQGTLDGEPFDGGSGEQVPIVIGEGRMLADFENGLSGLSAGEERTVDVTFPEDYQADNLAGKTAQFRLTATAVSEQTLPEVDEAFCKAFGVDEGGVEQLRADVKANMERELKERVDGEVRKQVVDALLAGNPVEVPGSLLEDEIRAVQQDTRQRMGLDEDAELPREHFEEAARRRVALGLLMGKLIEEKKLKAEPARVTGKLADIASTYERSEEVMRVYQDNPDMRQRIEMMVLEEMAIETLLADASVSEKKVSFSEIMDQENK